jgi:hypothetical protein
MADSDRISLSLQVRDGVALVQISNRVLGFASTERQLDDQGVPDMDMESQETASFWAGDADAALGEITASIPIKGCDNTKTKIVVWSGRKAEVYEINAETLSSTLMSSFETAATNMAIGSDETNEAVYLYMAVETRIAVANLQVISSTTEAKEKIEPGSSLFLWNSLQFTKTSLPHLSLSLSPSFPLPLSLSLSLPPPSPTRTRMHTHAQDTSAISDSIELSREW